LLLALLEPRAQPESELRELLVLRAMLARQGLLASDRLEQLESERKARLVRLAERFLHKLTDS
jgi:hypothetical protein